MKQAKITTLLLFVSITSFSQTVRLPLKDSTIMYENVVSLSDTSLKKPLLFSAAKIWFTNKFRDTKNVIRDQDASTGKVLAKGYCDQYSFTIEITVKDSKYRYRIYDFERYNANPHKFMVKSITTAYLRYLRKDPPRFIFETKNQAIKVYDEIFNDFDLSIKKMISSLSYCMDQSKPDEF